MKTKKELFSTIEGKIITATNNHHPRNEQIKDLELFVNDKKRNPQGLTFGIDGNRAIFSNGDSFLLTPPPFRGVSQVRSRSIIVGEMWIEKIDIKVINENTFKTENFTYLID
jgi:hypothetical protein